MWKKVVVTYLRILFKHLPGCAEENSEKSIRIAGFPSEA
jgi:hypothetical protein